MCTMLSLKIPYCLQALLMTLDMCTIKLNGISTSIHDFRYSIVTTANDLFLIPLSLVLLVLVHCQLYIVLKLL